MTAESRTYSDADYSVIDPVLSQWAERHGLNIDCDYKGYVVRSIWWQGKIQIWLDAPDSEEHVLINAAEKRPDLRSQWGRSLKYRVQVPELAAGLETVWSEVKKWT